jgi:hypothetical protein
MWIVQNRKVLREKRRLNGLNRLLSSQVVVLQW